MKIKERMKELKFFDWKLFIALSVLSLFPAVYQMLRTFLISTTISPVALDVIGQMEWFDLINETLQAFLIVPLYAIFNQLFKERRSFQDNVFRLGTIVFFLYLVFSIGIFIYGKYLVLGMNSETIDVKTVNRYLQLETIAFAIGILTSFVNVIFVVVGKEKNMYILLVVNCLLLVASDYFFIPHWGINGVAISNAVINLLMAGVGILILRLNHFIRISKWEKGTWTIFKN